MPRSYLKLLHPVHVELVSKELNHLVAILHVYAGGLIFMKEKEKILFFKKKMEICTFMYTFNHFYSKKTPKRAN